MRVLLLISESWNDITYPNNNMTNWFSGFTQVEIFTITCGAEYPHNACCKNYYMLNDLSMVRSFLPGNQAGRILKLENFPLSAEKAITPFEYRVYQKRDKLHKPILRLARDFIWRFGKINVRSLQGFLKDANPDIIFSQRMGSVKMCRLESIVQSYSKAPMIAYTGDNEYLQDGLTGSFIERIHRIWTRKWLDKMIPTYKLYYCMSEEQMKFYEKKFAVRTKFLVKCGDFSEELVHKKVHQPIRIVYAGKLYCGRDETLKVISDVIRQINKEKNTFVLDIFTNDTISKEQEASLNDCITSIIHDAVPANKLPEIYKNSDIVLHVEGLDQKNILKTKYSFSTKIMDCISSGCAVLAVCDPTQAGFAYLKKNDIAFTATEKESLYRVLEMIQNSSELICDYSKKAYLFGSQNHSRAATQSMILKDFEEIINESVTD